MVELLLLAAKIFSYRMKEREPKFTCSVLWVRHFTNLEENKNKHFTYFDIEVEPFCFSTFAISTYFFKKGLCSYADTTPHSEASLFLRE